MEIVCNDGEVIKSEVETICGSTLRTPMYNINFESQGTKQIRWVPNTFNEKAAYYEVVGYFHYRQLNNIGEDTVKYSMKWVMGSGTGDDLWNSSDRQLYVNYTPCSFYDRLKSTDKLRELPRLSARSLLNKRDSTQPFASRIITSQP